MIEEFALSPNAAHALERAIDAIAAELRALPRGTRPPRMAFIAHEPACGCVTCAIIDPLPTDPKSSWEVVIALVHAWVAAGLNVRHVTVLEARRAFGLCERHVGFRLEYGNGRPNWVDVRTEAQTSDPVGAEGARRPKPCRGSMKERTDGG